MLNQKMQRCYGYSIETVLAEGLLFNKHVLKDGKAFDGSAFAVKAHSQFNRFSITVRFAS